jgi:hypothetical protein
MTELAPFAAALIAWLLIHRASLNPLWGRVRTDDHSAYVAAMAEFRQAMLDMQRTIYAALIPAFAALTAELRRWQEDQPEYEDDA